MAVSAAAAAKVSTKPVVAAAFKTPEPMPTFNTTALSSGLTTLSPTERNRLLSALSDTKASWPRSVFFIPGPDVWSTYKGGPPISVTSLYVPFAQALGHPIEEIKIPVTAELAPYVQPPGAKVALIDIRALSVLFDPERDIEEEISQIIFYEGGVAAEKVMCVHQRTLENVKRLQPKAK